LNVSTCPSPKVMTHRDQYRHSGRISPMSTIRAKDRDAVIQSLRAGVVPRVGQHLIQVGRWASLMR
jgi:hypothetical protein